MIRLYDGYGQLGTKLKKIIEKNPNLEVEENIIIYHKWTVFNKSEEIQKDCFNEFKSFINSNKNSKIIFISTYSETENYYNHYKQLSEAYLSLKNPSGFSIRLPTLIGKGICEKFRDESCEVFGSMELMSIDDAVKNIMQKIHYNGLIKVHRINGEKISANLAYELIKFGKNGSEVKNNVF